MIFLKIWLTTVILTLVLLLISMIFADQNKTCARIEDICLMAMLVHLVIIGLILTCGTLYLVWRMKI